VTFVDISATHEIYINFKLYFNKFAWIVEIITKVTGGTVFLCYPLCDWQKFEEKMLLTLHRDNIE